MNSRSKKLTRRCNDRDGGVSEGSVIREKRERTKETQMHFSEVTRKFVSWCVCAFGSKSGTGGEGGGGTRPRHGNINGPLSIIEVWSQMQATTGLVVKCGQRGVVPVLSNKDVLHLWSIVVGKFKVRARV